MTCKYRVMVEGEDGLIFCTEMDLEAGAASTVALRAAYEDYPEAREIWTENQRDSFSILQGRIDDNTEDLY